MNRRADDLKRHREGDSDDDSDDERPAKRRRGDPDAVAPDPDAEEQESARAAWLAEDWEDSIEWFVDILGTMEVLDRVIRGRFAGRRATLRVIDLDDRNNRVVRTLFRSIRVKQRQIANGRRHVSWTPDELALTGIFFLAGHWYSCQNGEVRDSYSSQYQKSGTAHFCQTFATMIHLGVEHSAEPNLNLVVGRLGHNVRVAIRFWRVQLQQHDLCTRILVEIRTSNWAQRAGRATIWIPSGRNNGRFIRLRDIDVRALLHFLDLMEEQAEHLARTKTS